MPTERQRITAFEGWLDGVRGRSLGPLEGFNGGWSAAIEHVRGYIDRTIEAEESVSASDATDRAMQGYVLAELGALRDVVLVVDSDVAEHAGAVYQVGDPAPGTKQSTLGALDPLVGTPKPPGYAPSEEKK